MKVAVIGASGYGGQMLMRLLLDHPEVKTVLPVSSSAIGSPIHTRDAGIGPDPYCKLPQNHVFLSRDAALEKKPDVVFSALPPGFSAEFCAPFVGKAILFDLSADLRLIDPQIHFSTYGFPAPLPEHRHQTVYGLSEIFAAEIASASIIAVPGCYPTCTLLPLIPLVQSNLIQETIIVNAVSGISGAGRKPKESSLFVERSESIAAYNPARLHRHVPEMTQNLLKFGCRAPLYFTPHLAPLRRGMAATIAIPVQGQPEELNDRIHAIYASAYASLPFVSLCGKNIPDTQDVLGSNRCDIGWQVFKGPDKEGCMLFIFSVLDNLMKGASGQAVQNFNIRFGFPETTALPTRGMV